MLEIILHIHNEDAVVGEIDQLPNPADQLIIVRHPRRRDGKDLIYINPKVDTVIWPITRVSFIEVLPGEEEEEIISHVRE